MCDMCLLHARISGWCFNIVQNLPAMLQSLLKCTDAANYSELMTDVPVS